MSRTDGLRKRRYYGAQLMRKAQRKAQRMQAARQQQAADDEELMRRFRAVILEGKELEWVLKGQLTKLLKRAPALFGAREQIALVQQISSTVRSVGTTAS